MSLKKNFLTSMLLGSAVLAASQNETLAAEPKMERCYGVVKSGHNDCSDLKNVHSCVGQSTVNGGKDEWILLPKGVCERLVNGKTV